MPCPMGVDIPGIFKIRNNAAIYGTVDAAKAAYGRMEEKSRQTSCVHCRKCVSMCPQHIEIPEKLAEAHQYLTAE